MDREQVTQRTTGLIVDHLGVDPEQVRPEANFVDDLSADSLDVIELVMAFEEEFGVEIGDDESEKIVTVGDAVDLIASKLEA